MDTEVSYILIIKKDLLSLYHRKRWYKHKRWYKMSKLDALLELWNSKLPLPEQLQQRLDRKFTLEFNYNSNHIEGNQLTYGQTEILLLFGKVVNAANMRDLEEMKSHDVALKMMISEAKETGRPLTEVFIRQLHQIMFREDYEERRVAPDGTVYSYTVHVGRYKTRGNSVRTKTGELFEYASKEETPGLMYDLVKWYNEEAEKGALTAIELATLFHYRYIRIHPFEDGNGRISRLLMNFILLRHNYPMIVVRHKDKDRYLDALAKSDANVDPRPSFGAKASIEQIAPFLDYMKKALEKEIEDNLAFIDETAENVWWFNGEFVTFRSQNTIKILNLLFEHPGITVRELVEDVGINKSAIQKQLASLQEKGFIVRTDGKRGTWHVAIVCTTGKGGTR